MRENCTFVRVQFFCREIKDFGNYSIIISLSMLSSLEFNGSSISCFFSYDPINNFPVNHFAKKKKKTQNLPDPRDTFYGQWIKNDDVDESRLP